MEGGGGESLYKFTPSNIFSYSFFFWGGGYPKRKNIRIKKYIIYNIVQISVWYI